MIDPKQGPLFIPARDAVPSDPRVALGAKSEIKVVKKPASAPKRQFSLLGS
jgi:hypothetical protein